MDATQVPLSRVLLLVPHHITSICASCEYVMITELKLINMLLAPSALGVLLHFANQLLMSHSKLVDGILPI